MALWTFALACVFVVAVAASFAWYLCRMVGQMLAPFESKLTALEGRVDDLGDDVELLKAAVLGHLEWHDEQEPARLERGS